MLAPFLEPHLLDLHVHVLRYSLCLCEHLKSEDLDIDYVLLGTVWNVAICFLFPDWAYFLPATKSFLDMAASKKQIHSVRNIIKA